MGENSATTTDDGGRFEALLNGASQLCKAVGLPEDVLIDIYKVESDWAFIIQVDALLETTTKQTVASLLQLNVGGRLVGKEKLSSFVESLPIRGRTSLSVLLQAAGCDEQSWKYVEAVRTVRNRYAHDIRNVNSRLVELIEQLPQSRSLMKALMPIETYDHDDLVKSCKENHAFTRFAIFDQAMRFLTICHGVAFKP